MPAKSKIEWTELTWNPVTGCSKVSPGCSRCYAEVFAERFRGVPGHAYEMGFDLTLRPERLEAPLSWRTPSFVFVNSMSDLFHEDVPLEYIQRVFSTMEKASWHTFQVLTKRSDRLSEIASKLDWPENVWMGVSVENQRWTTRISELAKVPAAVRFLSCEPLLGPLDLDLTHIDWVIVGGESGRRARMMKKQWLLSIRRQCIEAGVPMFFKQWGAFDELGTRRRSKRLAGRTLDGDEFNAMPNQSRNLTMVPSGNVPALS